MKIIVDTREQQPWFVFPPDGIQTEIRKQKTGDYTLEGFEDKICIERKKTVLEIAGNVNKKRFIKECERMSAYKYRYIVCEFDCEDVINYPESANVSARVKSKLRMTGAFLLKRLLELCLQYDITLMFASDRPYAETLVVSLFKRIIEIEG